jgi:hypothetical protein
MGVSFSSSKMAIYFLLAYFFLVLGFIAMIFYKDKIAINSFNLTFISLLLGLLAALLKK